MSSLISSVYILGVKLTNFDILKFKIGAEACGINEISLTLSLDLYVIFFSLFWSSAPDQNFNKTTFQVKLVLQIWCCQKSSSYRTWATRLPSNDSYKLGEPMQTLFWPNKVFVSPLSNSCLKTVKKKIIFVCLQPITKLWEVTPSVGKFLIFCLLWYKIQLCQRLRININESTAKIGVLISRIA